ncbi:Nuclear RNA export factor 5 [Clarias magur]|uniref:Nuclear RNA export factor 5 n=1 Tax=Clarias magur TaxID=1594786 RepID=A0A8J4XHP4_CLAMG|nr:Nuclear RNA export factor 5 [Clarias magur]
MLAQCRANTQPDVWGAAQRLWMKGYNTCRHGLELKAARQRRWCNKHFPLQQALRILVLASQGSQLPS